MKSIRLPILSLAVFFVLLTLPVQQSYAQDTGNLQVTIDPEEARLAGAQWRRSGQTEWRNSGDIETDIEAGSVTVEFRTIDGWRTPRSSTIWIFSGDTRRYTATYFRDTEDRAYIQVFIGPEEARQNGAQWRIVGLDNWNNSGERVAVAANSQFDVEFKRIDEWIKPSNVTVNTGVFFDSTITLTVYYSAGQLNVTIEPEQARSDGAGWRLAGSLPDTEDGWYPSGTTLTGVEPGEEEIIEFKPVSGWKQPDPKEIPILEGVTTFAEGVYTRKTGQLRVFLEPRAVRDAGAKWRLAKPESPTETPIYPWRNSGDTEIRIPTGEYLVEFLEPDELTQPGWQRPPNQVVVIRENLTEEITATYLQPHEDGGAVQVVIEPAGARDEGALWRIIGTTDWLDSGVTVRALIPGEHAIEYNIISGWTTPPNRTLTVAKGETKRITGVYTRSALGSLQILIEPDGARDAGAQWRRAGTTTWFDSGVTEEGVPFDVYDVEFKAVSGWERPPDDHVDINEARTFFRTGRYTRDNLGVLEVIIEPEAAREAGAQWRRVGTTQWMNSGYMEQGIEAGVFDIEFKPVTGWISPANRTLELVAGETNTVTGSYAQSGALQVIIEPDGARSAGAQWRRTSTTTWFDSGDIEAGIPSGTHIIEFKEVSGWTSPPNQTVAVPAGATFTGSFSYTDIRPGSLQVLISPSTAQAEGARWRRVGTTPWLESGHVEEGLASGGYDIEFREVFGWSVPAIRHVTVAPDQVASIAVIYSRPHGAGLLVRIEPEDARATGAQWRRVGTDSWRSSGFIEAGLPEGTYTVEFKDIPGWTTPNTSGVNIFDGSGYLLGVYRVPGEPAGDLHVLIEPDNVNLSGAQWRRTGTRVWRRSGEMEFNVSSESHSIEYKPVVRMDPS